jgi:hypothetical protein
LKAGWHEVRVIKYELTNNPNSGNDGVEFYVKDRHDNQCKATFWLTEKAMRRLAWFAQACGLTEEEAKGYEPLDGRSHRLLIGMRVRVLVVPQRNDPKYHEVSEWEALGEEATPDIEAPAASVGESVAMAAATAFVETETPKGSDIPF